MSKAWRKDEGKSHAWWKAQATNTGLDPEESASHTEHLMMCGHDAIFMLLYTCTTTKTIVGLPLPSMLLSACKHRQQPASSTIYADTSGKSSLLVVLQ
jgi:hypothetical protein